MFKSKRSYYVLPVATALTAIAGTASAEITAPTIDFSAAGTAIMGQVTAAMPVGLSVLGILLGISIGIALFKRLSKGK